MSRIISRDDLSGYVRWKLPSMDPGEESLSEPEPPACASAVEEQSVPAPVLPTDEEIEAIRRQAREEGHALGHRSGYETGHQEGLAAGRQEITAEAEKLRQVLDFMSQPLAELDVAVENELVHLAIEIARQLVRRELKTAPGEIVAVVREAVGLLPVASQGVQVYLHPQDARLVQEILDLDNRSPAWQIIEEPTLTRGGCRVISEKSRIDATVEKRLGAVIASVLGDERE